VRALGRAIQEPEQIGDAAASDIPDARDRRVQESGALVVVVEEKAEVQRGRCQQDAGERSTGCTSATGEAPARPCRYSLSVDGVGVYLFPHPHVRTPKVACDRARKLAHQPSDYHLIDTLGGNRRP